VTIKAATDAHFVICGGAPMDGRATSVEFRVVAERTYRAAKAEWKAATSAKCGRRDRVHSAAEK